MVEKVPKCKPGEKRCRLTCRPERIDKPPLAYARVKIAPNPLWNFREVRIWQEKALSEVFVDLNQVNGQSLVKDRSSPSSVSPHMGLCPHQTISDPMLMPQVE